MQFHLFVQISVQIYYPNMHLKLNVEQFRIVAHTCLCFLIKFATSLNPGGSVQRHLLRIYQYRRLNEMKLSSPPIVTSFELSCVRQPIPFNIQTLL